jgi:enamine deaminase RidA (YjgF/YER057c/UK114 family)
MALMINTMQTVAGRSFLTLRPQPAEPLEDFAQRFTDTVRTQRLTVTRMLAIGPRAERDAALAALDAACGRVDWPVTWLDNPILTGFQAHLTPARTERLRHRGRHIGAIFEDAAGRWCELGNLTVDRPDLDLTARYEATFEEAKALLEANGFSFDDVARTWLYVHHILESYAELNVARRNFFTRHGVFDKLVPASTGIGASEAGGAALSMDILALQPNSGRVTPVPSPLQCPALDYGSAFSRAVVLPVTEELLISGTASIAPEGHTLYDDPVNQVELTMQVVEAILSDNGRTWRDVTRAVIYVKDAAAERAARAWQKTRDLDLPAVWLESDICRDDLLYEIEVDAARPGGAS